MNDEQQATATEEAARQRVLQAKRALGGLLTALEAGVKEYNQLVQLLDRKAALLNEHYVEAMRRQRIIGVRNAEPIVAPGRRVDVHRPRVALAEHPPRDDLYAALIATTERETAQREAQLKAAAAAAVKRSGLTKIATEGGVPIGPSVR